MAKAQPTKKTLEFCRKLEWPAHVVEKWIPHTRIRVDVFGFGDVLALDGKAGSLLIQATSDANIMSRVHKIRKECRELAIAWLSADNRIEVWGWGKRGAAGKRKLWRVRRIEITLKVFSTKTGVRRRLDYHEVTDGNET